ncbi:MAG: Dabb family protein [Clostridia bacterium]|nr:Dabb family protein [Clostridia bacterium]
MVKHMIIWKMKDEVADKAATAMEIKRALEGLVGKIEGLIEMHILTECYACSAGDVMMDSSFTDFAALEAYQKHPLHVAIADGLVRPAMCQRLSFDYDVL